MRTGRAQYRRRDGRLQGPDGSLCRFRYTSGSSAQGAKAGNSYHFGDYSNFDAWSERWGWYYEDVVDGMERVKNNYKGTLIWDFYYHDNSQGPLKTYDF